MMLFQNGTTWQFAGRKEGEVNKLERRRKKKKKEAETTFKCLKEAVAV